MFHHRHLPQLSAFALVFLCAGPARAADAPPSLAAALKALKPPKGETILAVGAAQSPLPEGEASPGPDAPLSAVALTFHKILRRFGAVAAVAPPTTTLLNTRPVNPNIYDGMPPQEAMKFLAASLTPGQWQHLKGEQGLGLSDMVSETQSSLFRALLPQKLLVMPQTPAETTQGNAVPPMRDLTAALPQVRLRLQRRMNLMVPQVGDSSFLFAKQIPDAALKRYRLVSDEYFVFKSSLYGVPVKAEVENLPKLGDLDWDGAALRAPVPLAGVKTVGELLARAGKSSGLELYTDPRWEGRPVTLFGTPPSAPAADVLRAVAFCLTGAYRRVGPALVLTDDVLGAGSRRAALAQFEATASALRRKALLAAGDSMAGVRSLADLSPAADSMTYSAAQKKEADQFYADSGFSSVTQTLDQLTPKQRAAAEATRAYKDSDGTAHTPDLNGKFIAQEVPYLELLVPTLDGPVDTSLSTMLYALFQSSPVPPSDPKAAAPPPALAPAVPALSLAAVTRPILARAVLASPRTEAEVQGLVAAMKTLGLNQLWLPVTPATGPGLLPQAVQATRGMGIGVYAVVDLLTQPRPLPANAADLTLLGRTSAQAQADIAQREALTEPGGDSPPANGVMLGTAVSPFSAAVSRDLLALTHILAATPGLAGTVWRATAPPGYDDDGTEPDPVFLALGYTPTARLAFLRREHADPVDLFPASARGLVDTSLPLFDDPALENTLEKKWRQFRVDADTSLLTALFRQAAADGAASAFRPVLLVQQRRQSPHFTWYGSWAGPGTPFPTFRSAVGVLASEKTQARAQSKFIMVALPVQSPLEQAAILRRWSVGLQGIAKNHSWDGFVLDCQPAGSAP